MAAGYLSTYIATRVGNVESEWLLEATKPAKPASLAKSAMFATEDGTTDRIEEMHENQE